MSALIVLSDQEEKEVSTMVEHVIKDASVLTIRSISDAIRAVETHNNYLGADAFNAVSDSLKIVLEYTTGSYSAPDANKLLEEQAIRIRKNKGPAKVLVEDLFLHAKIIKGSIGGIAGYTLYTHWTNFVRAILSLKVLVGKAAVVGAKSALINSLASLKDIQEYIPENASWKDYLTYFMHHSPSEFKELYTDVLSQLGVDESSPIYQMKSLLSALSSEESPQLALEKAKDILGEIPLEEEKVSSINSGTFLQSVTSGVSSFIQSNIANLPTVGKLLLDSQVGKAIQNLSPIGREIRSYQRELAKQIEKSEFEVKQVVGDIQHQIKEVYIARDSTINILITVVVILLFMVLYTLVTRCRSAYSHTERRKQAKVKRVIDEVAVRIDTVMSSVVKAPDQRVYTQDELDILVKARMIQGNDAPSTVVLDQNRRRSKSRSSRIRYLKD